FTVEPQLLELVNLDPHIVHDPKATDAFDQFVLLERVWRPGHQVKLYSSTGRPYQALDNDHVLISLVLDEQRMSRLLDEAADSVPTPWAPDEPGPVAQIEPLSLPVGFEALDDLADLMRMGGHHRVVAGLRQILGCRVERLDKSGLSIHPHRFLVGELEGGVAVDDFNSGTGELAPRVLVVFLAGASGVVQDHPDLHAAPPRGDDRLEQRRI